MVMTLSMYREPNSIEANVYPVPSDGSLTITFENEKAENTMINVYSVNGELVYNTNSIGTSVEIKKGQLNSGTYIYQISNASGSARGMIIFE